MKKLCIAELLIFALLLAGCDWSAGGDDGSYTDRYNWVNFSGVYRPVNGLYVVTDFSQGVSATGGTPDVSYEENMTEQVETGDGSTTVFTGVLSQNNVVAGSAVFSTAGFTLTDDGASGLSGSGVSGTIEYSTGGWSIDFGGAAPDAGSPIMATYRYVVNISGTPGTGADLPDAGTSGFELFAFTIHQAGEQLVITDNTGREYKGTMRSIRTTNGASQDTPSDTTEAVTAGDQVIGQFQAEGISPAGYEVRMTGTFQAVVGSSGELSQRVMMGTWVEVGGVAGSINAQAAPIAVTLPTATATTTSTTTTTATATPTP